MSECLKPKSTENMRFNLWSREPLIKSIARPVVRLGSPTKLAEAVGGRLGLLSVFLLSLALIACSGDQGDDLDQFMRDAANKMQPKIKPLPEVKPYLALQYNADGTLTDPFRSRKAINKSGVHQPNLSRPKEPMEAYPLESIKYVGLLSNRKLTYALLKTPDNGVQQVKLGNYVGQNYGMVTQITDSEVVLKEIVQDDLSGDWIERVANIALQE